MEVKVVSKECIKPSSPTPIHLRTYKLSFLDQFSLSSLVPMVLFYPMEDRVSIQNHDGLVEERSKLLKQSLSQTLSYFYPLAGKIKDNLTIDCNDDGVYYVQSRVNSDLLEFLSQPDISLIQKFLPHSPSWNDSIEGAHVAFVQENVFECGGIAISASVTHMIADGVAMGTFLKCWGKIARGCFGQSPDFSTIPSLFPQNEHFPKELSLMALSYPFFKLGKVTTKRFVFDSPSLAALKEKATSSSNQNPSRVEVVSALIWKCARKVFRASSGIQKPSILTHCVNLRLKAEPPFSEYTMGNFLTLAVAQCETSKTELSELALEIRVAKTKTKSWFLKRLEGDEQFTDFCDAVKEIGEVFSSAGISNEGVDYLSFTSWISLGLYEVDFGWGKPTWVTGGGLHSKEASPMLNLVFLKDTRLGNGIEAWVCIDEQDMAILERDEELLTFSSLNPSPLMSVI